MQRNFEDKVISEISKRIKKANDDLEKWEAECLRKHLEDVNSGKPFVFRGFVKLAKANKMDIAKEIKELKTDVYNLQMQLALITNHLVAQNYCQCTCSFASVNNVCGQCNKPFMPSGVAKTGT